MAVCGGGVEECPGCPLDVELRGEIAFFADADQADRAAHAGRQPCADPAALVHDAGEMDSPLLEQLPHHLAPVEPARFLVVPQAEQDRPLRPVALREQDFGGFEDSDELVLDVQRAAAPDEFAGDLALERRVGPTGRVCGYHVLVRHQHDRLEVAPAALPGVEQTVAVDHLALELLVRQWIARLEKLMQLPEGLGFGRALVVERRRLAAHRGCQVIGHCARIDGNPDEGLDRTIAAREQQRAHDHVDDGNDQDRQDEKKNRRQHGATSAPASSRIACA